MRGFDTQYDIAFALDQQTTAGHLGKMASPQVMVDTFNASRQPQPPRFAADAQGADAVEAKNFAGVKQESCVGEHVELPVSSGQFTLLASLAQMICFPGLC